MAGPDVQCHWRDSRTCDRVQRKAWQLRDRASDHERFYIDFSYHKFVTGNLEKAIRACELWAQAYPRDEMPHAFLGSSATTALSKFEKAARESRKAIELDPDQAMAYANLAATYRFRNQFEEAERTVQRARDRRLEIPDFQIAAFYFAFLKDDTAEMERVAALSQDDPELQDLMCDQQGFALAYHGQLRQARIMSQRAADLGRQSDHTEAAAQHDAAAAVREALFGWMTEARKRALSTLALSNSREARYWCSHRSGAFRGSVQGSNTGRRFRPPLSGRYCDALQLPTDFAGGHRSEASRVVESIRATQTTAPYELSWQGCCSVGFISVTLSCVCPRSGLSGCSSGTGVGGGVSENTQSSRDSWD